MTKPASKALTVRQLIRWGERRLATAGVYFGHGTDNALDEAAWLVCASLHIPYEELDAHLDTVASDAQEQTVRQRVEERIGTRKPAAYLLHEAWFAGLRFYVDERVIIPRSHLGEFIRDAFSPWVEPDRVHAALDLCTGSGCIAIALAHAFPDARIDASDISPDALAVAERNVESYGLQSRVRLVQSDLLAGLPGCRYDLIVSNPPYVDAADMASLPDEYRFEPPIALASGTDGLDAITRILADAPEHLTPQGVLVAEVGNSCVALQERFPDVPFLWLTTSSGDESVFLLTAKQLVEHRARFTASGAV